MASSDAHYPYLGNVSLHLQTWSKALPKALAIATPIGRNNRRQRIYATRSFEQLEADVQAVASGLYTLGLRKQMRIALLVKPGVEFTTLVFGLLRAGAVIVLIDPGIGRKHLLRCLADVEPEGFIAVPVAHAVRSLFRHRFPKAHLNVTVGTKWFWGGATYQQLIKLGSQSKSLPVEARDHDPAAIIFTSGSTGPPKGVLYTHRIFEQQVFEIQKQYRIQAGEIDLTGFPLFALFNAAMGVTTITPEMDASRPAKLNPIKFLESLGDFRVTQSFGSPAIWNRIVEHCERCCVHLPNLKRVMSAGASVPPKLQARIRERIPEDAEVHTPYGATECLPVATIESREVLEETAQLTRQGRGVCVGRRFPGIRWKVIRAVDQDLPSISAAEELPLGEIGELIVQGAVVTKEYVTRTEWNAKSKIQDDSATFWHRIGDVGYLDGEDRFWYCGRKSHRVLTFSGPLYTEMCEAVVNEHPCVARSALVGVGRPGEQLPVIVVEPKAGQFPKPAAQYALVQELRAITSANPNTAEIRTFLFHRSLPVDVRHNAKIFREKLAPWAAKELEKTVIRKGPEKR